MVAIVFVLAVAIVIVAIFMFFKKGEFVSAFRDELDMSPLFYITALTVVFLSSIVYTPFSFGISKYLINSKTNTQRFADIFYLFSRPRLLLKAVVANSIKKLIIAGYRIVVLLFAVMFECLLFAAVLFFKTNNIEKSISVLVQKASFAATNGVFIFFTVIAWALVILLFIYVKTKYILCKYALILKPEISALQSIRIGRRAVNKKIFKTVAFYIKYVAIYMFVFLTLGLSGVKSVKNTRDSFSLYAIGLVKNYCDMLNF